MMEKFYSESKGNLSLLLLVDSSKKSSYAFLEETTFSALEHFGMPYRIIDLSKDSLSMDDFPLHSPPPSPTPQKASESGSKVPTDTSSDPEDVFNPIILAAANRCDVDPAIIKAIIKAESEYNPRAISNKGAKGLMQLMPNTAKMLGVEDSFCPVQNIYAGVEYFKRLLDRFSGNTKLALAAYNAGSRKVRKYKGIPPFKTTKIYIKKVFEYHRQYKQQMTENG